MSTMTKLLTDRDLEEKVIDLVERARKQYGIPEGCRGRDACIALGLNLVDGKLPKGTNGLLRTNGTLVVNSDIVWVSRREFTIFHEAIHWLLNEDGEIYDYLSDTYPNNPEHIDKVLERCCEMGAAEFMMPRKRVQEYIERESFSVDLVERLGGMNGASTVAATVQLAKQAPVECYIAVCGYGVSPRFWPPDQTLYVEQATWTRGVKYPWARCSPIPANHLFHQVWESRRPMAGPTFLRFPNSGKEKAIQHGEAKMVGNQVVGILYEGHPPRRGQLTMELRPE